MLLLCIILLLFLELYNNLSTLEVNDSKESLNELFEFDKDNILLDFSLMSEFKFDIFFD